MVDDGDEDPAPLGPWEELREYPLPLEFASEAPPEGLDPWIMSMAQLDEAGVREALRARWEGITEKGPTALRETLLECRPASLVVLDDVAHLKLLGPADGLLYLGPPIAEAALQASLDSFGYSDNLALLEFYRNFHGLRDSEPGLSGGFISPPAWNTFEEFGWSLAEEDEFWSSAVALFNALNGDLLLLGDEGIAWAIMARGSVRKLGDSFDDFLQAYAEFLRRGEGLDSYSLSP